MIESRHISTVGNGLSDRGKKVITLKRRSRGCGSCSADGSYDMISLSSPPEYLKDNSVSSKQDCFSSSLQS